MADELYGDILRTVSARRDLSQAQAHAVFSQLMAGELTEVQTAGLLAAMATKGPAIDEITGAAQAMREHSVKIDPAGLDVVDIVGTGGTGLQTFNISTTSCFVAAGAGLAVAKHGSYTNLRPSGSANVLMSLGVNIEVSPAVVTRCLKEASVGFCFAVKCHPAMRHAVPVRRALPIKTIFNILGPLTNPAGARRQIMGVYDAALTEPLAEVLGKLGSQRAWVLHGLDGLDEISIAGPTKISELRDGAVTTRTICPEDFGLATAPLESVFVDSPEASAQALRDVLSGLAGPRRDIVLLNAAAALVLAERATDMNEALELARQSIDSGAAQTALDKMIAITNEGKEKSNQ